MKRLLAGLLLCCGLVSVTAGCSEPEPLYPASLKPCDLYSQRDAERLLGVEMDAPEQDLGSSGGHTLIRHCTWEYLRVDKPESGPMVPSARALIVTLVVFDRDSGGVDRAVEHQRKSFEGGHPVARIGDEASWRCQINWREADLQFRRDNAVVKLSISGTDGTAGLRPRAGSCAVPR
jgi:hypothetical protein